MIPQSAWNMLYKVAKSALCEQRLSEWDSFRKTNKMKIGRDVSFHLNQYYPFFHRQLPSLVLINNHKSFERGEIRVFMATFTHSQIKVFQIIILALNSSSLSLAISTLALLYFSSLGSMLISNRNLVL